MPLDLSSLSGRRIVWLDSTDSTMSEAARIAREGCPSNTVVGSEEQTAGRGRYDRRWLSERESGLYFTVVLRPKIPADSTPVVTLALGLAAADGIQAATGIRCDLRWPNDLLIEGRKCCGILAQFEETAVLAGIGINVNHQSMPDELAAIATSLCIAAGKPFSREIVLSNVLDGIDHYMDVLARWGSPAILDIFTRRSSYARGRPVEVEQSGTLLRGVTDGLDTSGFLFLRQPDGTRTLILAGGVRPADESVL